MAKSVRSKWRRKMRSEKRAKNAVRDRARAVRLARKGAQYLAAQADEPNSQGESGSVMEVEPIAVLRDPKTMRDQHGRYPEWMNRRRIQKIKKKEKVEKKAKAKKQKPKKKLW